DDRSSGREGLDRQGSHHPRDADRHPPRGRRHDHQLSRAVRVQAPPKPTMKLEYKFVELSIVTDETIEEAVNAWVSRGWLFEGIRFVTNEASRRPQMAFVSFTREQM